MVMAEEHRNIHRPSWNGVAFEADAFGVGMRVYQKKTTSCSIGESVYNSYIVNIHVEEEESSEGSGK